MKVLHVMPSLARAYGGPVEALIGYVAAGRSVDVAAMVLGPRSTPDDLGWLGRQLPDATLVAVGSGSAGTWRSAPAVVTQLRAMLSDADVVHVHGLLNPISSGAARAALHRDRPLVIGPFGTLSRYTFEHRRSVAKRLYFRSIDAPNLRRAAAIHFTTAAEREEAQWLGIDFGHRAHVVPPPYVNWVRRPDTAVADRGATVLFLGRLHPKKGVDVLLDAWPDVHARRSDVRLVIAGAGDSRYETALRARAASLGRAAPSVSFVGFVRGSIKAEHLLRSSVCVLPSQHENFGIVVLDAIAAGVPMVLTPDVHLAPWVAAHGLGRVAERTPAAVADAIIAVLADDALRARVRMCGAAAVARDFAPASVAPSLRAMYDAAQSSGGARGGEGGARSGHGAG
jgi:glycosyltransferase involved in cell wall biosynthesis